jgi:hypothetical protein
MNPAGLSLPDLLGAILGFVLTLLVFTYLLGDNILFRLVIHLFIGVASGFIAVVVFYNVILNQVLFPLVQSPGTSLLLLPPLFLGLWLLFSRGIARFNRLGTPVVAFLVGVAAATAISGAIIGTIFPQTAAAANEFDLAGARDANLIAYLVRGLLILLGVITTLVYFHFSTRPSADGTTQRASWINGLGRVGQYFIAITLGTLFAGVYTAALTALIERLQSLITFILPYLPAL